MFALVVHEEGRVSWRKAFASTEVSIGAGRDNNLVLDDWKRVSRHHARVVVKDGKYILVDLKSATGTFVNGRKMVAPLVVKERDVIVIGNTRVAIVTLDYDEVGDDNVVPRDAKEADLLEQIARGDDASRLVYADWLEGIGDCEHAEVLRIQHQLADEHDENVLDMRTARIRELATEIDLPWRARLAKAPIENCSVKFKFKCPKQWAQLGVSKKDGVRFCGECDKHVYYCATIDEARGHAQQGHSVALDVTSPRWTGDLDGPFGERVCEACELDVGVNLRFCPRCGARVEALMMLGEMA